MTMSLPARLRAALPSINAALFASLFFFLPGHVAPAYTLTGLILVVTLLEGGLAAKWTQLRGDPLFWIFQAFFWIVPFSLLWTEDTQSGLKMAGRYGFFLLSPLYLTVARRELAPRCIAVFLAGCAMSEALAYYNWLQMLHFPDWPRGIRVRKDLEDTAPFVDHILYAPILAWAGYLAARQALSGTLGRRIGYLLLTLATLGNLVFSGGRAGQLAFLVLLVILAFQRLAKRPVAAALVSIALVGGIAALGYTGNDYLRARVDETIRETSQSEKNIATSTGQRFTFYANSLRLFAEHPLFGVGAGDFEQEYAQTNKRHSPDWMTTNNPHNQYLFVLTTTGVLGGAILLLAYFPPILWRRRQDALAQLRVGLAVFIGFISLFEDYLWRSNTSLLFVLFAALLLSQRSLGGTPSQPPYA
jgi:O-antigen ligase